MEEHYQLSPQEYLKLLSKGVTLKDLYDCLKFFCPFNKFIPVSYISLFFYADTGRNFIEVINTPADKIANFLWEKLPIKQKIEVAEYIDYIENGESDERT